jgi:hypothetical protein
MIQMIDIQGHPQHPEYWFCRYQKENRERTMTKTEVMQGHLEVGRVKGVKML